MIVGHYAAALLPYARRTDLPFPALLVCANLPELVWLGLALVGVEAPDPPGVLDATFANLHVDMTFSHNLVPALLQAALATGVVHARWRRPALSLWCGALVVLHVLCDYVVGFEHQLLGADSLVVSLNSYGRWPIGAIFIELAFALACVGWFAWGRASVGRPFPRTRLAALAAVLGVGILAWAPAAHTPLRALLGLS